MAKIYPHHAADWFLTWFGSGYLRPLSGTWGTLAALPFLMGVAALWGPWALLAVAGLFYLIAVPLIRAYERRTGTHDSSAIVIDEVIGMSLALIPAALNPIDIIVAFLLFRLFDGVKPGPIGWLDDHLAGPHGVLADDVVAGLFSAMGVLILHIVLSL